LVLHYPASLGLAQLGLTFSTMLRWGVGPGQFLCCSTSVSLTYATLAETYQGSPEATYRSPTGKTAWLFSAGQRRGPGNGSREDLVFQFGPWLAEVDTTVSGAQAVTHSMTEADRQMWTDDLDGSLVGGGYLRLHPHPPLGSMAPGSLGAVGVKFGPTDLLGPPRIIIGDGFCGQPESDTSYRRRFQDAQGPPGVAWCDPASGLHFDASGPELFVDLAATGLTVAATPIHE
jgi:hypothetical protein